MKKKYKILVVISLLLYPIYKGVRELLWVKHSSYSINQNIKIKLRVDTDIFTFQDFSNNKSITIVNSETKSEMKIAYVSQESDLYFYLDTLKAKKKLSIVDKFSGQNIYDLSTLKLESTTDCFKEFGNCSGFNDSSFAKLGKPYLIYDIRGFHN